MIRTQQVANNTKTTENVVVDLLSKACNIFMKGAKWHHAMSLKLSYMNLHGAKRWHKIQSGEDWGCYEKIAYYMVDMFDYIIEVEVETPKTMNGYRDYLIEYLKWETYVKEQISAISNELMTLGYIYESELVSSHVAGVIDEIKHIKRWLDDYEMVNGDYAYLKIADAKLHDKLKKKMEK